MKKLLNLSFASLLMLGIVSCTDDPNGLTGDAVTGGLLNVETAAVAYIQGAPASDVYTADLSVFQGREKVESVDVYKQFYHADDVTGEVSTSEKVLFTSFSFPISNQNERQQLIFTYADLIDDLSLNGTALSTDDSTLSIGDYWLFTYVSNLTDGSTSNVNAKTTKITVSCGSFLEGVYRVNYTSGPEDFIITAKGGGLYEMNTMLGWRAAQGYITEFTDVCGTLTFVNPWVFPNEIGGVGTVQPNGDILWTDVFVQDVYSGSTYLMTKL